MLVLVVRFQLDEGGAALVEYGLLVSLIAVICLTAVTLLGEEISSAFSSYVAALSVV
jgi:pilus assembly protein Flp/PilA